MDSDDGNAFDDDEADEDGLVSWPARTAPLGEWAEYVPQRTLQFVSAPVFSTHPMQRYLETPSVAVQEPHAVVPAPVDDVEPRSWQRFDLERNLRNRSRDSE